MEGRAERQAEAQYAVKLPPFIEIEQLAATTDQNIIDENFRDALTVAAYPHFCCQEKVISDIMLDKIDTLYAQQLFGASTVSAIASGIDFYFECHS